ncbi:sensor domain-containing phosphodiesterase [Silvibacterium acidisoli]|uniref:sensor domain-containing phosphodiesterase n=1 Tax=Acidobacteriaceae bacterium ZG23-2 TaxID=2883246 RepID=UPI00406D1AA5
MVVDEQDLLRSLNLGEIVPYYQPMRELRTGRLMGFELLARWSHPTEGLILPAIFISMAEKAGLLPRLTEQVLASAFQSVGDLSESVMLAVNISPMQLRDPDLPYQLFKAGEESDFPLSRLVVEVTETALVDNLDLATEITRKLKRMGCSIFLDDFGTGYSSLAHLQTLYFDGLKIDKSFVNGITRVREDRKIVAAIIGLGQSLGITTIAEGIETEEQASMLLYLGCDMGQGYLYGRPLPASGISGVVDVVAPVAPARNAFNNDEVSLLSLGSFPIERAAQLHAIYDGAPVGLCYLSRELRYISVNRRFSEIEGAAILSMIGRTVKEVFPDRFSLYEPYLRRALGGEALRGFELTRPALHAGDPNQVILFSCEPARDEANVVIGLSLAVMDITERKQREQELKESELRFRTIIDLNPETPWILDKNGNIIEIGSKWEKVTGFTREEVLNRGYLDTVVDEDREGVIEIIQHCLSTGEPMDFECRATRFDGSVFWIRLRGKAVLDDAGKVWRFYGSTEDIDELKRLREMVKAFTARSEGHG